MHFNSGVIVSRGIAVLIDPGIFPDEIAEIRSFLAEAAPGPGTVILTHSHWDHVLGPEHFPGVRVVAQASFLSAEHGLGNERRLGRTLDEIERWEVENDIHRREPFVIPSPTELFDKRLTLGVGDVRLELQHAPGHWPDELVVYERSSGVLWAGDMLSDIEIPYVSHSLTAYEETLRMLRQLDIRTLIPGHGAATSKRDDIDRRLVGDQLYLRELRQAVERWRAQGRLPEMRGSRIVEGFTDISRLEANLYPHRLNIETVWQELSGESGDKGSGWGVG